MQQVGKIVDLNRQKIFSGAVVSPRTTNPQTMSSPSSDVNSDNKRIDLLFSRFAAFYGHIWRSQFKDEGFLNFAKKEWSVALKEFTDSVFNKAIMNCREFYEMPPTLPQMVNCCRQLKKHTSFYVVSHDSVPATQTVVISHLQRCKELLTQN